jgi:hypothetical protein
MIGLGSIKGKKKLVLYRSVGNYLVSKDGRKVYIYEKGVLYDTDRYGKKTTSNRMSKLDLIIK